MTSTEQAGERRIGGKTLTALGVGLGAAAIAMIGSTEPKSLEDPSIGTIARVQLECILLSVGGSAVVNGLRIAADQREAIAASTEIVEQ